MESLKKGNIYSSNAKTFIELEKEQLKRGQGDRAEGRLGFNSVQAELKNRYTNEVVACFNNIDILTSFEGVDTMPVFCITAGRKKDCSEYKNENHYTIKFSGEVKRTITEDFPNADSAIVIT
ncbi:hypothetical protein EXM99_01675 [Clostridium botulinum]|nr:hypothetical protein [Clostridium botulinum]